MKGFGSELLERRLRSAHCLVGALYRLTRGYDARGREIDRNKSEVH